MKISKYLSLEELIHSETAIKRGINNYPTPSQIENLKIVGEKVFDVVREHFNEPLHISSGFRSVQLNTAIGGAGTSQHCYGQALDIDSKGKIKNSEIFNYIKKNLQFDQLIWEAGNDKEPDWVHVSYNTEVGSKQRNSILKATKNKAGKMIYTNFK